MEDYCLLKKLSLYKDFEMIILNGRLASGEKDGDYFSRIARLFCNRPVCSSRCFASFHYIFWDTGWDFLETRLITVRICLNNETNISDILQLLPKLKWKDKHLFIERMNELVVNSEQVTFDNDKELDILLNIIHQSIAKDYVPTNNVLTCKQ